MVRKRSPVQARQVALNSATCWFNNVSALFLFYDVRNECLYFNSTKKVYMITIKGEQYENCFAWSRPRRTIMERCNLLSTNSYSCKSLSLFNHLNSTDTATLDDLTKYIEVQLNQIKEPFILCGLSLGAVIALNYLATPSPYLKRLF